MAADANPGIGQSPPERTAELRAALCRISEKYGWGICREPRRLAAMLHDLCPEQSRESFLLVAALRQRVVLDMVGELDSLPEEVLVARGAGRLRDNLGLAEDSARWAVESWLPACRLLAGAPDLPLRLGPPERDEEAPADAATAGPIDWAWLALCLAASACSAIAVATVARCAFFHFWNTFSGWLKETSVLAAGLACAGFGMALVGRGMARRNAPNHRALDPDRSAGAMLVEVATLLTLPLAPVLTVGFWALEWIGSLHVTGQPHDLAFHLGRILQSQALVAFLYFWLPSMVSVQGKIASSMVRRR